MRASLSQLQNPVWLWIMAGLFFFNYLFETLKWRVLIEGYLFADWRQLVYGVLSGQALGLFAPVMTGDYAGRLIHIQKQGRHKVLGSYLAGLYIQGLFGICVGVLALGIYLVRADKMQALDFLGLMLLFFGIGIGLSYSFFAVKTLLRFVPSKWHYFLDSYRYFGHKRVIKVLFFFSLRYAVICLQFHFAFLAYGLRIGLLESVLASSMILSAKSVLPGLGVFVELGIRQLTVIYVMEWLGFDAMAASLASLWVWVVNMGAGSLLGAILLFWGRIR